MNKKMILSLFFIFGLVPMTFSQEGQDYRLEVEAQEIQNEKVEFVILTNIPLPVEVMVGITLIDLKPEETFIGDNERIWLRESKTKFVLDATGKGLPTGKYEARVSYYQRWGWKNGNLQAQKISDLATTKIIKIQGIGISTKAVKERDRLQLWVMEEIHMGYPWNLSLFMEKLGDFEKYDSTMSHLHDAYYFPKADMTLIVNRFRKEVTVWRMGKQQK